MVAVNLKRIFTTDPFLLLLKSNKGVLAIDILDKTWNEIQAFFSELHLIETSCTFGRQERQIESNAHIRSCRAGWWEGARASPTV